MSVDKLYDIDSTKLLLLFILKSIGHPLSRQTLTDACLDSGAADFYIIGPAISSLLESGQLVEDTDSNVLAITENGENIIFELSHRIPFSIRERVVAKSLFLSKKMLRSEQIKTKIAPLKGGYQVTLEIIDGETVLLSLSLFSATDEEAHILCDNFRRTAEKFYTDILKALTALRQ